MSVHQLKEALTKPSWHGPDNGESCAPSVIPINIRECEADSSSFDNTAHCIALNTAHPHTYFNKKYHAYIKNIDLKKNEVVIHVRKQNTTFILGFDEIIKHEEIIKGFSPKHASHIGYYYGMYCYNYLNKSKYPRTHLDCFKNISSNSYTISMLDRQGNLIYLDQLAGAQYVSTPLQIMLDERLIGKFSSGQSCYIGMLSGIARARQEFILRNNGAELP